MVGVTESLFAYNTVHRAKFGEVVWVSVCLAVVVLLLVAPNHNPIKSCFYKTRVKMKVKVRFILEVEMVNTHLLTCKKHCKVTSLSTRYLASIFLGNNRYPIKAKAKI